MTTAFDIIGSNKALQEHWIKRFLAALIDGLMIWIPLFFIFNVILWNTVGVWGWFVWGWWLFYGFIIFLYFILLEGTMQASIGKKLFNLRVVTTSGQPLGMGQVFIRNLFKILYPLLWIDVLLGMFTDGDPRQKYMDRVANVTVARSDAQAYVEEQFRQMQYVPPHPQVSPQAWGQPVQQQQAPQQPPYQPQPGQPAQQQYQPAPQQPVQQQLQGGWSQQQPQTWAPAPQANWPQHQWDDKGQLRAAVRFCSSCGGQLAARGDGKMACVRCGLVY